MKDNCQYPKCGKHRSLRLVSGGLFGPKGIFLCRPCYKRVRDNMSKLTKLQLERAGGSLTNGSD